MAVVTHGSFDEGPITLALPDYFAGALAAPESDPIFAAWDKTTGITIEQSQITDGGTIVNTDDLTTISIDTSGTIKASNVSGSNTGDQDLTVLVPYTGATSDVDLGVHNLTVSKITIDDAPIDSTDAATKGYVDSVVTTGTVWTSSVKDIVAVLPGGASAGDRYILSTDNHINEWAGVWVSTLPAPGTTLYVEGDVSLPVNNVGIHAYNGSTWIYVGGAIQHNDTTNKQGGTTGEYYHLTSAQKTNVTNLASAAYSATNAFLAVAGTAADSNKLGGIAAASYAPTANPTFSGTITLPSTYSISIDAGDLVIKYGATVILRLTSAGYLSVKDEVKGFA
jgi:hypothetical protein